MKTTGFCFDQCDFSSVFFWLQHLLAFAELKLLNRSTENVTLNKRRFLAFLWKGIPPPPNQYSDTNKSLFFLLFETPSTDLDFKFSGAVGVSIRKQATFSICSSPILIWTSTLMTWLAWPMSSGVLNQYWWLFFWAAQMDLRRSSGRGSAITNALVPQSGHLEPAWRWTLEAGAASSQLMVNALVATWAPHKHGWPHLHADLKSF